MHDKQSSTGDSLLYTIHIITPQTDNTASSTSISAVATYQHFSIIFLLVMQCNRTQLCCTQNRNAHHNESTQIDINKSHQAFSCIFEWSFGNRAICVFFSQQQKLAIKPTSPSTNTALSFSKYTQTDVFLRSQIDSITQ